MESTENAKAEFSFVMAAYNMGRYLDEAIESLTVQTVGFKEKIELVIINDGSTDNTLEVAERWRSKYPGNIKIITKKNEGQAVARKTGLPLASGKYVNFMDADDKWTKEACRHARDFFQRFEGKTDIVAYPITLFGATGRRHAYNSRFGKKPRVADLHSENDVMNLGLNNCFIKREALHSFDADPFLLRAEDAKECFKVQFGKMSIGLDPRARYCYRKHIESTLAKGPMKKAYYLAHVTRFLMWALSYAKKMLGYVPMSLATVLLRDIQFPPIGVLSEGEEEEFLEELKPFLREIPALVIKDAPRRFCGMENVVFLKAEEEKAPVGTRDGRFFFKFPDCELPFDARAEIYEIKVGEHQCKIGGAWHSPDEIFRSCRLVFRSGGETFRPRFGEVERGRFSPPKRHFEISLPLGKARTTIEARFSFAKGKEEAAKISFSGSVLLADDIGGTFCVDKASGKTVSFEDGKIIVSDKSAFGRMRMSLRFVLSLAKNRNIDLRLAALWQIAAMAQSLLSRRNVWLLSDRIERAGDNAEAFFRFLREKHPSVNAVFAVSGESEDFARLSKIGKVVPYGSIRHKFALFRAKYVLSSQGNAIVNSPFGLGTRIYGNILCKSVRVFLQHGVVFNDLSDFYSRENDMSDIWLSSAKRERESIISNPKYGVSEKQVLQTGMPRFDLLEDAPSNMIAIMPTWRRSLSDRRLFAKSAFLTEWNRVLSSKELMDALEAMGCKVTLALHPNLSENAGMFSLDPRIGICSSGQYSSTISQSALLVTDYSSVQFDFGYLRRPVLYFQFDRERFHEEHGVRPSYFDTERDGFGEAETEAGALIARILEYAKAGFRLKEEYKSRMDAFFMPRDKMNSDRLYRCLVSYGGNNNR